MNLVDWEQTGIARVVSEIRRLAREAGTDIHHCELIGLAPTGALLEVCRRCAGAARLLAGPGPGAAPGQGPNDASIARMIAARRHRGRSRPRPSPPASCAVPDGAALPPVGHRAPVASGAWRLRHQRGHAAGAGGARRRRCGSPRRCARTSARRRMPAEVSVRRPGFLNLRLDPAWVAGQVDRHPRRPAPSFGRVPVDRAASDQRRVRQRQPDRAADGRATRAARSSATC